MTILGQQILFTSADVKSNSTFFQEFAMVAQNGSLDIFMNITQDFPQDPWISMAILMKIPNKTEHRKLLQYNVNMCKILSKNERSLISIWLQNIFKLGDIPKKCPIIEGYYTWCGLRPEMLNIPPFFARGEYCVKMELYFRQRKPKISLANMTIIVEKK
uniref:MD-2-related lipid-recognition domain-containing protein n=1 Tax=Musca domestica TaxID=7370 RepID=A0A1I8MF66_MUSDO